MKLFKKSRRYKITVENVTEPDIPPSEKESLQFEVTDHEDIIAIVEKLRKHSSFDGETAASLGVGLRLFGGVMLKNKKDTLFSDLMPHFRGFMKGLKTSIKLNA